MSSKHITELVEAKAAKRFRGRRARQKQNAKKREVQVKRAGERAAVARGPPVALRFRGWCKSKMKNHGVEFCWLLGASCVLCVMGIVSIGIG